MICMLSVCVEFEISDRLVVGCVQWDVGSMDG